MVKEAGIPKIDLDQLFKSKNPSLYKWIPRFVMRWLKKVIHQDEVNRFMGLHQHEDAITFAKSVLVYLDIKVEVEGVENIPSKGNVVCVANHPLGGLDALAVVPQIHQVRSDLRFVVNDLLLNLAPLRTIFTGVNKHGKNSQTSLMSVDELFASDKLVFLFPSGLVSRKWDGMVQDLPWKKTFVSRARKYQSPVIPVYIDGHVSNFFYRMYRIRKMLGIKANIEMLWLVDEMYRQKGRTIKVVFGKPILSETFTKEKTDAAWTLWVRNIVYQLSEKSNERSR